MKPDPDTRPPRLRPPPSPFLLAGPRWPVRPLLFAFGVLGAFVCGIAALFALATDEPAAVQDHELEWLMSAPEASETLPPYFYEVAERPAALTLRSSPEGAHVTLNAESLGPTPLSLDALRPGYYELRLRLPDHAALDTTLYFASGARYHLDLELTPFAEPEPPPDDAAAPSRDRVQQRGRPAPGGTTPDRFARADDETIRRAWHTGSLSVTSTPSGARVLVDGQPRGQTPLALGGLRPGPYEVAVSLRGYETETRSVVVGAGAVHHVEARLTR